ncbi:protein PIN-LIKES 3-like [Vigna umbellata]|uniref:protein PIN-LIKES 3-like n=1 Tax=Vigna umbellata TaxID=87088 RepID=UPI001F5EAD55|nr:protein PIN-LIKES 3-like [Vigna umbellata]
MEILKLFVIALMPNLKVLLLTVLGSLLAMNRFNILSESAINNMNTMVYFVFSPALACSSLASTITLRSLIALWFMPFCIVLTVVVGTALGWLLVKITRVPYHLRGLVLGCCAVGNLGNLPLMVVPAICKEKSSPFGDENLCYKNGMAYASLSLALASILVWSFAYNIVRMYSIKNISTEKVTENPTFASESDAKSLSEVSTQTMAIETDERSHTNNDQHEIETYVVLHKEKMVTIFNILEKEKLRKYVKMLCKWSNLKQLFPPTLIGALVGLLIGVVPQFRHLIVGGSAPLYVIQDSIIMIGNACLPAMTMLVGANLLEGLKGERVKISVLFGIIVVRNIAMPVLGVAIVKGAVHFGIIHHDPLYEFVLMLQFALPPAVAISTSTQLFETGKGECSIIMLATYSFAAVSLTLWCTFFIWLVL